MNKYFVDDLQGYWGGKIKTTHCTLGCADFYICLKKDSIWKNQFTFMDQNRISCLKILIEKDIGSKKMLSQKNFWVNKCGSNENLGPNGTLGKWKFRVKTRKGLEKLRRKQIGSQKFR